MTHADETNWTRTETGNVYHWFPSLDGKAKGTEAAACRGNVTAGQNGVQMDLTTARKDAAEPRIGLKVCKSCETKFLAAVARFEASMAPVNPYDQVCEGVEPGETSGMDECCEHEAMYHGARGCG